jgi:tRNA A-37 threonylcarbamoyl transferase component Bud32
VAVAADRRVGTEFGDYRIEALIGRGGMSVVYRAHHAGLKRNVALKLLSADLAEDEVFRRRFLRESQLAASLDHPNVVPIYEAGEVDGLLYIAMRFVDGTDLKTVLRREGALGGERALAIATQLAGALDAAHERGLIHRDVKPSNVLVTGRPGHEHCYLADFGLSTSVSDRSAAVSPRQIVGTIDYVAPEQIRDEEVDARADVYSLACLFYESLTGAVPFRRGSDVAVIYAHLEESPPPPSRVRSALPPALDPVLDRGLAKEPDERWQTSGALVDAARSALATDRPRRSLLARRRRLLAPAVAVLAAAVAIAVAFGGGGTPVASAETLVRLDADGSPVGGLELDGRPTAVTVCAGSVWVTTADGAVAEIDPQTLTVHRVHVAGTPSDVADVGSLAAIVSGPPMHVTMVDAQYGEVSVTVGFPPNSGRSATAVAFGPNIWVANPGRHTVDRLSEPYTAVSGSVRTSGAPRLLAAGQGALWAVGGRSLWKIVGGEVRARIRLPIAPVGMAAGNGGVWLVDGRSPTLLRLDPRTGRVTKTIRVGRSPVAVAVGPKSVWTVNRADGTVSRVDPARNSVRSTVDVGSDPVDLVVGLGSVWVVRR